MNSNLHAELKAKIERNEIRETYLTALVLELGEIAQAYRDEETVTCTECGERSDAADWYSYSKDRSACPRCEAHWSRQACYLPYSPVKYAREKLDAQKVTK